eukprot:CAMPEP_0204913470 /NCGR_PEP_ID=MMETSP1397-20131031/11323_1 /ASSEMBLY_ACC=CAM_ASM_000891 /TAXON_ID=49980 /ORGANISM="Climacostomum Climacostomum virens, Strain Stock W-24" /LENGTH=453 /DNA_ID=CAMNT_0052084705 /DNA_START=851 /DNA_END=2209 /DNA_ORIENTATION=+
MAKLAVCSRQVVTFDKSAPCPAVILVEGDSIVDVVEFDPNTQISDILATYADWNPVDYSDFVISPGQIDTSVKINPDWESITDASSAAVASGVTLMLVEANLFQSEFDYETLHCDVGDIVIVSSPDEIRLASLGKSIAVKSYLFPPNNEVKEVFDLPSLFAAARDENLPMVVDPLNAAERVLMLASPCRLRPYCERLSSDDNEMNFPAAYPDDIQSETSENETNDKFDLRSALLESSKERSPSQDAHKELHKATTPMRTFCKVTEKKPDVISSLNKRLASQDRGMELLSKADAVTYLDSGKTSFSTLAELVADNCAASQLAETPPPISFKGRLSSRRPTPILTEKKCNSSPNTAKLDQLYSRYLANYPDSWEVSGIDKVVTALKTEECRLHLTNVTSAVAYRQVLLARAAGQNLTCEVSLSHLYFSAEKIKMGDTRFKASPPIRLESNRALLW